VAFSDPAFTTEPEDRSQASARDYPAVLHKAATKSEPALERLFQISASSSWDAAGAEFHFSHMRRMLLLWGDHDFAVVLARQPKTVRREILQAISFSGPDPAIPYLFPRTYSAATK
jgi:hypothetical protein